MPFFYYTLIDINGFKAITMKKSIGIFMLIMGLYACTEPTSNQPPAEKTQTAASDFKQMPNEKTIYVSILANSIEENTDLLTAVSTRLLQQNFDFFEKDSGTSWSENDCGLNKIVQVKGQGIRSYKAISKEKLGAEKKIRPDFIILVFAFDHEQQAEQSYQMIASAVYSAGGFCNGKSPETIVRNGKEVFYLTTRAEMFRSYIDDYAKFIQQYAMQNAESSASTQQVQ